MVVVVGKSFDRSPIEDDPSSRQHDTRERRAHQNRIALWWHEIGKVKRLTIIRPNRRYPYESRFIGPLSRSADRDCADKMWASGVVRLAIFLPCRLADPPIVEFKCWITSCQDYGFGDL